jgi:hypothetical protein
MTGTMTMTFQSMVHYDHVLERSEQFFAFSERFGIL